jgi:hypothetical protein
MCWKNENQKSIWSHGAESCKPRREGGCARASKRWQLVGAMFRCVRAMLVPCTTAEELITS